MSTHLSIEYLKKYIILHKKKYYMYQTKSHSKYKHFIPFIMEFVLSPAISFAFI